MSSDNDNKIDVALFLSVLAMLMSKAGSGGSSNASSTTSLLAPGSNGFLVNTPGGLLARALTFTSEFNILNPAGQAGNPLFIMSGQLGEHTFNQASTFNKFYHSFSTVNDMNPRMYFNTDTGFFITINGELDATGTITKLNDALPSGVLVYATSGTPQLRLAMNDSAVTHTWNLATASNRLFSLIPSLSEIQVEKGTQTCRGVGQSHLITGTNLLVPFQFPMPFSAVPAGAQVITTTTSQNTQNNMATVNNLNRFGGNLSIPATAAGLANTFWIGEITISS